MNESWSDLEVELIVQDYFLMLMQELEVRPYNKSEHRTKLSPLLQNRSKGSIEFKHQNISAVLAKHGRPYIKGYKPRWNYQLILEEKVLDYLCDHKFVLEPLFVQFSEYLPQALQRPLGFENILEEAPQKQIIYQPEKVYDKRQFKTNYLEREQNNTLLGMQGEEYVIEYEKWTLRKHGKSNLADQIEWISQVDDSAGFDILSKNLDGSNKYIEVKTTKLAKETPIFFSMNEYKFSLKESSQYHLYRLFNFTADLKMFAVKGSFDDFCFKEAIQFKGLF